GIVLDPAGSPVPFAELDFAIHPKGSGVHYQDIKPAMSDGSFEFTLDADSYLSITAKDPENRYGPASAERIDAGEQHLRLQLVEGEQIELRVLGDAGMEITEYKYEVLASEDELTLQKGEGKSISQGGTLFRSPAQPFFVRITAPCYQVATVGPFRSGELDCSLEVRLTPLPGLRGIILADDQPVKGARIMLHTLAGEDQRIERSGFRCWLDPEPIDRSLSDEEGRFVVTPRESCSYIVRVEKSGFAPHEIGPIKIDPDVDSDPVEVRMTGGGTIEGSVILPYNEDPTGTIVSINRGDGHAQTVRIGPDGSYCFTHLIPGSWCVEKRDQEIWQVSTTTSPRVTPFESEVKWNCEVYDGKTTRYDLVIAPEGAFSLRGSLTLGEDTPVEGWIAWLCPPDGYYFDNLGKYPTTTLDPRGDFEVNVKAAGEYRLVVKYASMEAERLFTDKVVITGPATPWNSKITLGSLVVEGLAPLSEDQDMPEMVYIWEGDISFLSLVIPDEKGECRLQNIPAGEGRFVKPTMKSMDPNDWEVIGKVTVKIGVETRVPAPKSPGS
ncbi:MAG: carboxypeptidase-like regulatory domain-containing protein, partial [Planctomycetota bacterium]